MTRHSIRFITVLSAVSGIFLSSSPIPLTQAHADSENIASQLLTDYCLRPESVGVGSAHDEEKGSPEGNAGTIENDAVNSEVSVTNLDDASAEERACSPDSDRARIHLNEPKTTVVADPMALTRNEKALVAQAVRVANEHLFGEAETSEATSTDLPLTTSATSMKSYSSSFDEATAAREGVRGGEIIRESADSSFVRQASSPDLFTAESGATEDAETAITEGGSSVGTDTQEETSEGEELRSEPNSARNLTDEELTYREGETVPEMVKDRQPGIYVDLQGRAGVVFKDSSFTLFPQSVTVAERPLSLRSATVPAASDIGEEPTEPGEEPTEPGEEPTEPGEEPTMPSNEGMKIDGVEIPSVNTSRVYNRLHFDVPWFPSRITVDATSNGNGNAGTSYADVAATERRVDESQPAHNEETPLKVTMNELSSSSGAVNVRHEQSQATVWYSSVSDYKEGRYQPTPTDTRLPYIISPRMTISAINLRAKTARVTYQFYLDTRVFAERNRRVSGIYAAPYARYRSDTDSSGDGITRFFIPTGAATNTNNCRIREVRASVQPRSLICFPQNRANNILFATVPIVEVGENSRTYRVQTGLNTDWLLATFDGPINARFRYVKPENFDETGTYHPSNSETYHLLETVRVQVPDVIVSVTTPQPELPLTGGVSDVAYRLAGVTLLIVALLLVAIQAQRRRCQ